MIAVEAFESLDQARLDLDVRNRGVKEAKKRGQNFN